MHIYQPGPIIAMALIFVTYHPVSIRAAPVPTPASEPWEFLLGDDGEVLGVLPSGSNDSAREMDVEFEVGFGDQEGA